jgi:hypothetical protein
MVELVVGLHFSRYDDNTMKSKTTLKKIQTEDHAAAFFAARHSEGPILHNYHLPLLRGKMLLAPTRLSGLGSFKRDKPRMGFNVLFRDEKFFFKVFLI